MKLKNPKSKSLARMAKEVVRIFKEYQKTGTKPWDYDIAAKDLSYQVGSLTKLLMQMEGERYAHGKSQSELKNEVADELADILAEVLFISHELDINIEKAWGKMLDSDKDKIYKRQKHKKKG